MKRRTAAFDSFGWFSCGVALWSTEFGSMGIEGATQSQVRPIPSVSGSHPAEGPAMSRMSSLADGVCTRDSSNNTDRDTSFFARPGLTRSPWMNKPMTTNTPPTDSARSEDNSVVTVDDASFKKEVLQGRFEDSALSRKVASMNVNHLRQQAAPHIFARAPGSSKHPPTAQLTIFYAGMVNVFDDVPLDKAQAIMLLAGTDSTCSSNHMNLPAGSGRPFSTRMSQPSSRAGSPAPQMNTSSAGTATLPGLPRAVNRQVLTATTGLIVELPQARKASLARFLEKRKDRVRRGPYTDSRNEDAARDDESRRSGRQHSPCPSDPKGKIPVRSPSPPATKNQGNAPFPGGATTSGSELNSPPNTPPGQNSSDDRSHETLEKLKESETRIEVTVPSREKTSPSRNGTGSWTEPMGEHSS